MDERITKTISNLEKNCIKAFYVKNRLEALQIVGDLLEKGATVTTGGSVTLDEVGVNELIKNGDYKFIDRFSAVTDEEKHSIKAKIFTADYFMCSCNAVTENGELYNVDGNSNRVAAILYGPKNVVMVVGKNKIVSDINAAVKRVKQIAAPQNTARLNCDTYCKSQGKCSSIETGGDMPSGCNSADRICCNYVVSARQRHKDRIKVIIVDEILGY